VACAAARRRPGKFPEARGDYTTPFLYIFIGTGYHPEEKDEGGRMKDEKKQEPFLLFFILHPSAFILLFV
jgi:hypothetical protein